MNYVHPLQVCRFRVFLFPFHLSNLLLWPENNKLSKPSIHNIFFSNNISNFEIEIIAFLKKLEALCLFEPTIVSSEDSENNQFFGTKVKMEKTNIPATSTATGSAYEFVEYKVNPTNTIWALFGDNLDTIRDEMAALGGKLSHRLERNGNNNTKGFIFKENVDRNVQVAIFFIIIK